MSFIGEQILSKWNDLNLYLLFSHFIQKKKKLIFPLIFTSLKFKCINWENV